MTSWDENTLYIGDSCSFQTLMDLTKQTVEGEGEGKADKLYLYHIHNCITSALLKRS